MYANHPNIKSHSLQWGFDALSQMTLKVLTGMKMRNSRVKLIPQATHMITDNATNLRWSWPGILTSQSLKLKKWAIKILFKLKKIKNFAARQCKRAIGSKPAAIIKLQYSYHPEHK